MWVFPFLPVEHSYGLHRADCHMLATSLSRYSDMMPATSKVGSSSMEVFVSIEQLDGDSTSVKTCLTGR